MDDEVRCGNQKRGISVPQSRVSWGGWRHLELGGEDSSRCGESIHNKRENRLRLNHLYHLVRVLLHGKVPNSARGQEHPKFTNVGKSTTPRDTLTHKKNTCILPRRTTRAIVPQFFNFDASASPTVKVPALGGLSHSRCSSMRIYVRN